LKDCELVVVVLLLPDVPQAASNAPASGNSAANLIPPVRTSFVLDISVLPWPPLIVPGKRPAFVSPMIPARAPKDAAHPWQPPPYLKRMRHFPQVGDVTVD
jgi:hypothetical protein